MDTNIAYGLMLATLGFFGYIGYQAATEKELNTDEYLSARGTQSWLRIGLSLFASGMGIWILFGPSEVGYWGGFWDVVGYAVSASTPFLLLAYVGPMVREKLPDDFQTAEYLEDHGMIDMVIPRNQQHEKLGSILSMLMHKAET